MNRQLLTNNNFLLPFSFPLLRLSSLTQRRRPLPLLRARKLLQLKMTRVMEMMARALATSMTGKKKRRNPKLRHLVPSHPRSRKWWPERERNLLVRRQQTMMKKRRRRKTRQASHPRRLQRPPQQMTTMRKTPSLPSPPPSHRPRANRLLMMTMMMLLLRRHQSRQNQVERKVSSCPTYLPLFFLS